MCFSKALKIGAIFIKLGRAPTIHAMRSFLVIEIKEICVYCLRKRTRPLCLQLDTVTSKSVDELVESIPIIIKQVEVPVKFVCCFKTTSGINAHGRVITIVIVFLGR